MTIIAFDGRYIAADSQVTQGNRRSSAVWQKLIIEDGAVFGFVGFAQNFENELIEAYFSDFSKYERTQNEHGSWRYARKNGSGVQRFIGGGEGDLIVFDGGNLMQFNGSSHGHCHSAPAAFGSGEAYALGALSTGASAMSAATVASRWDLHCSGDIVYVDTKRIKSGVRVYGPTPRAIEVRKAQKEEASLLDMMQALAEKEITLDGIAAEVELEPGQICDFLPEISGKKKYADLIFAIEAWTGD